MGLSELELNIIINDHKHGFEWATEQSYKISSSSIAADIVISFTKISRGKTENTGRKWSLLQDEVIFHCQLMFTDEGEDLCH